MFQFFRALFGTDFMPHLYCLRNDPAVLWLQVVSDLAIAVAYFAIPLLLFDVVREREDRRFRLVALLFVLFIGACGLTHVLGVWTIWIPVYRLEAVAKAATAIFSILTAIVLFRLRPMLLKLPSVAQLEKEIEERLRAEQRALAAKGQLAVMVDSVQDYAVYSIDPAGIVRSWDLSAERMKGYRFEEIIGKNFSCFYSPADIASKSPEDALRIATEKGRFETDGWRYRKDGSRFWANVVMRPQRDEMGKLLGFTKITHDLTESRETESKFQALLEAAPDAILIVTQQGIITFANAQAERIYGYDRAELLGKQTEMLSPPELRPAQGKIREELFSRHDRAEINADAGLLNMRKDGTTFPVEFTLSPLETREGWVFLFAIRNVYERLKAEMRFQALLGSAPDAMVIADEQGRIELANEQTEKLFGYRIEELIGQKVEMLMPESLHAVHGSHRDNFHKAPQKRGMGTEIDLMARHKDGSLFPVEISLSPMEGANGITVTAAIRDVTASRMAQRHLASVVEELRHTNEELEQFAHVASHDLQEPLRMVASYTQLLAKRYKGRLDADADEFIGYAVDGTKRMKSLIEDLLAYSRTGKGTQFIEQFSSERPLKTALSNLQAAIEESGATVTSEPLPEIEAVEPQMAQLFQNLIGNAIKYRGERPPQVHVRAEQSGSTWVFSVQDNGIGIDPAYFERIFAIFQRLHGREEYEGTGVGLAICKRILQQLGGRIWIESKLGQGSTFYFSVPMR
jgi:PAS domain S-box-containing protein